MPMPMPSVTQAFILSAWMLFSLCLPAAVADDFVPPLVRPQTGASLQLSLNGPPRPADGSECFEVVARLGGRLGMLAADGSFTWCDATACTPVEPGEAADLGWQSQAELTRLSGQALRLDELLLGACSPAPQEPTAPDPEPANEPAPRQESYEPAEPPAEPATDPPARSVPPPEPQPPEPVPAEPSGDKDTLGDAERAMLTAINAERTARGLAALKTDPELMRLARQKTQDLIAHDVFSHTSPSYGTPQEMLDAAGVAYRRLGENLAADRDVASAHQALMASDGHRANLLDADFTHVGLGIGEGGPCGFIHTQLFIQKP